MGVTLERVQFKFASIIGELCSEPDILSQFAVWVDLRLAEYKLKGSISLDCSGDTPDPIWLQGILSALLAQKLAQQTYSSNSNQRNKSSERSFSRHKAPPMRRPRPVETLNIEDSGFNVKEEPDESIYPVELHTHDGPSGYRKRSAAESISAENDVQQTDILYSHTSMKQRRFENPPTESLMSIIDPQDHPDNNTDQHYDENKDSSGLLLNSQPDTMDLTLDSSSFLDSTSQFRDSGSTSFESANTSTSNLDDSIDRRRLEGNSSTSGFSGYPAPELSRSLFPSHAIDLSGSKSNLIKRRTHAQALNKNSRSSATIFERWLQNKRNSREARTIESILPNELDPLLAEFLLHIKKTSGGDYDVVSFSNLRYNIDRYLTAKCYGHTITRSSSFPLSQAAFRQRRTQLQARVPKTKLKMFSQEMASSFPGSIHHPL